MCGIAGFVLRDGLASPDAVRAMCDPIRHRGPDDSGYYVSGRCGLGMRRLSIVDLRTGHQPISNETETVWTVFNGEIYNHSDLRSWLERKGHHFRTDTDTEVLVHLYEEEGIAGIERLRGMFAFAIWDQPAQKLFLVRDRFGKKPLYYAALASGIWFGSELKSLTAANLPLTIDRDAIRLYFQFAYIPDPGSVYREVRKLTAGSYLEITKDRVQEWRYWRLPTPAETAEPGMTKDGAIAAVREKFDEAVRIRMHADVPLGAFLSGGFDSASVVASMALQTPDPVKTFSIGFEEDAFNELPAARWVARKFKTDHREFVVRPDVIGIVSHLAEVFDEPFGDSSAIPTFLVSQAAAEHVKVVLTGDGGDELFAGYESLQRVEAARRFDHLPGFARSLVRGIADRLPYSFYGKNFLRMASRPSAIERYFDLNYSPYYLRQQLLRPSWNLPADMGYIRQIFPETLGPEDADILTKAAYFEATTQLTSDMLVKVDRASMANSIEVRCPLLDQELAELAMRIPHNWKLHSGRGKQIFREAVGERLPRELLNLPKRGFAVPLSIWFRTSLRPFLRDHLQSSSFLQRDIVNPAFLETLISEHESGRRDNSHWLWSLLFLELWFRSCKVLPEKAAA